MMKRHTLGNDYYSAAHPSVYEKENKLRVAKQAQRVLSDFLGSPTFKHLTCLDLACSVGITSNYFASLFKNVIGVDIDPHAIAIAQKTHREKNLSFAREDALNLQLPARSFDVVICQEVYSYVTNPKRLFSEMYRALKPGGLVYFAGDNLLFPIESQYHIPLLLYLPDGLARFILTRLGHTTYFLGHYKTYWQLRHLASRFILHDYVARILEAPDAFGFNKLIKYKSILSRLPQGVLWHLRSIVPTFIWVLQKPYGATSRRPKSRN